MRNRAKCKLCNDVIESFHRHDYVACSCDEIAVDGGDCYFKSSAKDFNNFIRLNDDDTEFVPIFKEAPEEEVVVKPKNKEELLETINEMIKVFENLPSEAMQAPINHYDFLSLLHVIYTLFKT